MVAEAVAPLSAAWGSCRAAGSSGIPEVCLSWPLLGCEMTCQGVGGAGSGLGGLPGVGQLLGARGRYCSQLLNFKHSRIRHQSLTTSNRYYISWADPPMNFLEVLKIIVIRVI